MSESGASAGNSCVRVIPLELAGMDSKSWPGAEVRDWLKLVDDQAGTSARSGVGCAPTMVTAAKTIAAHARHPEQPPSQRTELHMEASHRPNNGREQGIAGHGRSRPAKGKCVQNLSTLP